MLVKNNMVGFSFSKIIVEHKDSQANESPRHLSMKPFYYKRKVKNLICRNNCSTGLAKLVICICHVIFLFIFGLLLLKLDFCQANHLLHTSSIKKPKVTKSIFYYTLKFLKILETLMEIW
jgi:hypothetical protein